MSIGVRIRQLRIKQNLTQKELADKIGITASTVTKYENGSLEPNISCIKSLSKLFNVTTDYLLGMKGISDIDELKYLIGLDKYSSIELLEEVKKRLE